LSRAAAPRIGCSMRDTSCYPPCVSQQPTFDQNLSVEAWARLPEEHLGELVDGSLVREEMPDAAHEIVILFLGALFRSWLAGEGFVLLSGVKYAVSARSGRKPDLSVFLPGGKIPPQRGLLREPPDIAIEVVSASPDDHRRDRVEKLREYAGFGVRYYWLLDPEARTLEILQLDAGRSYTHVVDATKGSLEVPGCPGLVLHLDALWSEIERLGPGDAGA
jgi:Uma2 family endonuclease